MKVQNIQVRLWLKYCKYINNLQILFLHKIKICFVVLKVNCIFLCYLICSTALKYFENIKEYFAMCMELLSKKLSLIAFFVVFWLGVIGISENNADAQVKVENDKMYFGPELVEFEDLSKKVAEFCKVNIIIPDNIRSKSKIYVLYPEGMSRDEAWQNYLTMLELMDILYKKTGKYKIAKPSKDIVTLPSSVYIQRLPENVKDNYMTLIYYYEHLKKEDIHKIIIPFTSVEGKIYAGENFMIFYELQERLHRILDILKAVDTGGENDKLYYWAAKYSPIEDISGIIERLFQDKKKNGAVGLNKIVIDERSNGMFILGAEDVCQNILELLPRLDIGMEQSTRMEVIFLQFAKAEELLSTITAVTSKRVRKSSKKHDFGDDLNMNVTADKSNNAIIVVGTPKGIREIKKLIAKLDKFPRQILLEVVVMEVTLGDNKNMGVAISGGKNMGNDNTMLFGGSSFASLNTVSIDPTSLMGAAVGAVGPTVSGSEDSLGMSIPKFGVLIRMLQQNSNVNVLANPYLMGMDAEEAEVIVGSNIPFVTGTSRDSNNNPVLSIQRQDVAMSVKLKPGINEKGNVKVQVEVTLEDLASMSETLGPTTTKRSVKTTVMGPSGSRIAIGGLIKENEIKDTDKVPGLGDMPILGRMFRNDKTGKEKTNLLIVITPHIINDMHEIKKIFKKKLDERSEYIREMYGEEDNKYRVREDFHDKTGIVEVLRQVVEEQKLQAEMSREEDVMIITPEDVKRQNYIDGLEGEDVEFNPPPPPEEEHLKSAPQEQY